MISNNEFRALDKLNAPIVINNVKIGDVFKTGKHGKAVVVDFIQRFSMIHGQIEGYECIAKSLAVSTNAFAVPFSTVVRNRIECHYD